MRCRTLRAFLQTRATPVLCTKCLIGQLPAHLHLLKTRMVLAAIPTVALLVSSPDTVDLPLHGSFLDLSYVVRHANSSEVLTSAVTLVSPNLTFRRVVTGPLNRRCLPVHLIEVLSVFRVTLIVRVVTLPWLLLSATTVTPKFLFMPFRMPLIGIPYLLKTTLAAGEE